VAAAGRALRSLRALRHNPPGYAKQGARRTTFQSALEQCEQFLDAASATGYATRPVQLFYALSQAGRAIVLHHRASVTRRGRSADTA
jgi:nitroreductase